MKKKAITKKQREMDVLIGLIELFLSSGKAVGSNTLRENGFEYISSATIRNYFATLEAKGYLKQEHTSGGRIPTDLALRLFVEQFVSDKSKHKTPQDDVEFLKTITQKETKKLSLYLQEVTEAISELTSLTTLITAPRFDQDFISKVILTKVDETLAVCIIVTDFGFIHTENLYLPSHMSTFSLKRIEEYFAYRLSGQNKPALAEEEEAFAKEAYNEIMLRHFINFSNMDKPDIYKGGFSKLLRHTEFHDPETLSNTLSLFENNHSLQALLFNNDSLKFHIGDDLRAIVPPPHKSALIQVPYFVHNKVVGNIAILGPTRMNYKEVISLLETVSDLLSENLTQNLYKFKLTYRTPKTSEITYTSSDLPVIGLTHKEKP